MKIISSTIGSNINIYPGIFINQLYVKRRNYRNFYNLYHSIFTRTQWAYLKMIEELHNIESPEIITLVINHEKNNLKL